MQHHSVPTPSGVFEIVARGLPYLDRRALSEAWYASLHIAERGAETAPRAPRVPVAPTPGAARASAASQANQSCEPTAVRTVALKSHAQAVLAAAADRNERRRPPLLLATRIAKTFTPAAPPASATFDIEHDGARVRVVMRRDAGSLRLIALCKPNARETVARALDEARFLLASRGVAVRSAQTKAVPA